MNTAYYNFSISNESNFVETLRLLSLIYTQVGQSRYGQIKYFENIQKNPEEIERFSNRSNIDKNKIYADISDLKVSEKLEKVEGYRELPYSDYYEAKLDFLNIANKSDYLNLLKLFDEILTEKMNEVKNKPVDILKAPITEQEKSKLRCFPEILSQMNNRIQNIDENDSALKYFPNGLYKMLLNMIEEEFKKLDFSLSSIDNVLSFIFSNVAYYTYEDLIRSKIIVLFLSKEYFETQKYKLLFQKFTKLRKTIFIVKLDDFDLNLTGKIKNSVKVYDMFRHKMDKYEGYVTRQLLVDIKNALNLKKVVSDLIQLIIV